MDFLKYFLIFFLLFLMIGCSINPVTGKHELMLVSESQEIAIGKKSDKEIVQEYGIYNNKILSDYVSTIGNKLLKYVHRKELKYHFRVLNSIQVNAFALPGGYVYITRGLLAYLNNEAQLAGVLGHELGHINARHSAKQMTNAMLAQIGLAAGMIAVPELKSFANLISEGVKLLFLKFSRDDENQADYLGVYYSSKAGYNSLEMANFFKTLKRLEPPKNQSLPEWALTHPSPLHRVAKVTDETYKVRKKLYYKQYITNRKNYLSKINGLVFGEDPREGYIENGYFYHPVLKFKFIVPKNWKIENSPSKVLMASNKKDSLIIFHLARENNLNEVVNKYLSNKNLKTFYYKKIKINGLYAAKTISVIRNNKLVLISYFINKDDKIYEFDCVYKNYNEKYGYIPNSFSNIFDFKKLNKKPKRIFVVPAPFSATFKTMLKKYKVNNKIIKKLAILNGIYPETFIKKGTLLKIIK